MKHAQPTNQPHAASPRAWLAGVLVASIGLVAACGGGSEASSGITTGSGSAAPGNVAWASGPITGLGSIIVNGVRYDDSLASVVRDDDDSAHSAASLKVGMMVEVSSSSPDDSANTASASSIRFGSEIVGPVSAVNTAASTITVLSQVIEITTTTVFDDSLTGGLSALTVGRVIEVHALYDAAASRYVATRVEDKSAATIYRLRGVVSALNTTAKTFQLGDAVISYANVTSLPTNLADGLRVRVALQTTQVNGQWVATAVRGGVKRVDDFGDARLRGTVTAFTSAQAFEVNGVKVDASAATIEPNAAAVVLGARVEVRGTTSNGVVVATRVVVKAEREAAWREVELHGLVSGLSSSAKTFVVRGVKVDYSAVTEWKDGVESNLADGRRVEVKGTWSTDRTTLKATRIEFES